jgi:hypothetical protein
VFSLPFTEAATSDRGLPVQRLSVIPELELGQEGWESNKEFGIKGWSEDGYHVVCRDSSALNDEVGDLLAGEQGRTELPPQFSELPLELPSTWNCTTTTPRSGICELAYHEVKRRAAVVE